MDEILRLYMQQETCKPSTHRGMSITKLPYRTRRKHSLTFVKRSLTSIERSSLLPRRRKTYAIDAIPHTVRHPRGDLPPSQALINQPHAHDKLLSGQHALVAAIHQLPDLHEFILRQTGAFPDFAHHDVEHTVCFLGGAFPAAAWPAATIWRASTAVVARVGGKEGVASVGGPDGLVAFSFSLGDLVAPSPAGALVMGVLVSGGFVPVGNLDAFWIIVLLAGGLSERLE